MDRSQGKQRESKSEMVPDTPFDPAGGRTRTETEAARAHADARRTAALAAADAGADADRRPARDPVGHPRMVAGFVHQVTGVTVAEDGRVFVCFPRWTEDSAVSVAELLPDGTTRPFPDERWNGFRNARKDELDPGEHWVCVQSVVADGRGGLWVLDPAAPAQDRLVPGGAKLARVDLGSGQVDKVVRFGEDTAPQGSYLNDVRFSPDGARAYITDSGAKGAILAVDIAAGTARRLLDGHPSTQVDKSVQVKADGEVLRRPDGRGVEFSADGIALSNDGGHLYWQAIKGTTLYRVPTRLLDDPHAGPDQVAAGVERVGENGVADGLLIGRDGTTMYVTAPEEDAVKVRDLSAPGDAPLRVLVRDPRLRWPDTLAQGPDGAVYLTTSRIQDSAFFKPDAPTALATQLWCIVEPS